MTVRETDILAWLTESSVSAVEGKTSKFIVEGVAAQDDCAVLRPDTNREICVTSDFVRGPGFYLFRSGHLELSDLGWYVVAANISDLAAMGAEPVCYLSIVRYQPSRTMGELEQILTGIADACRSFGATLVGGDTGTYEVDVLAGTAIGYVERGSRMSRHTLRPGDALFVSGNIGGAAAAIAAVVNTEEKSVSSHTARVAEATLDQLLQRWRRPLPQICLGRELARSGVVSSCMDVSDGITASLQKLQRITGLGFRLEGGELPIDSNVVEVAAAVGMDVFDLACGASVDFELLFSARPEEEDRLAEISGEIGVPITRIGSVLEDTELIFCRPDKGDEKMLPGVPWDHQHSDVRKVFAKG